MPAYGTVTYPSGVQKCPVFCPGLRAYVFGSLTAQAQNWAHAQGGSVWPPVGELVPVGTASLPVTVKRDEVHPNAVAIELTFSAAPGAFEFDVETADTDNPNDYQMMNAAKITTVNGNNVARLELPNVVARFIRLKCISFANAATVTVIGTIS